MLEAISNSSKVLLELIGFIEINVIENIIEIFQPKKIGQLSLGKDIRIQLNSEDMVILLKIKIEKKP